MTAAVQERPSALRSKKKTIGTSVLAGLGAIALAIGIPTAANAADYSTGDFDGIEVEVDGGQYEIHVHDHDGVVTFDPASDRFDVGSDGVILASDPTGLEVGLASEDASAPATTTIEITSATFKAGGTGSPVAANVEVGVTGATYRDIFNTVADFGAAAKTTYAAGNSTHVHPRWEFLSGWGEYQITFVIKDAAGSPTVSDSDPVTLKFWVPSV